MKRLDQERQIIRALEARTESPRTFSARREMEGGDPDVSRLATFCSPLPRRKLLTTLRTLDIGLGPL